MARNLLKSMDKRAKAQQYKRKNRRRGGKQSSLIDYNSFYAALFMDPRYMSMFEDDERLSAKSYLVNLWSRLVSLKSEEEKSSDSDGDEGPSPQMSRDEGDSDDADKEFEKLLDPKKQSNAYPEA